MGEPLIGIMGHEHLLPIYKQNEICDTLFIQNK